LARLLPSLNKHSPSGKRCMKRTIPSLAGFVTRFWLIVPVHQDRLSPYEGKKVKFIGRVDATNNLIHIENHPRDRVMMVGTKPATWKQRRSRKMDTNTFKIPMHELIERRAYQIYLERGFHPGNALEDWLAAEKEVTETSEIEYMKTSPTSVQSKRAATA
jgi:hypothetical protein